MGLYRDVLFPAAYDGLMRLGGFDRFRAGALAGVGGEILEVGVGTGLNLPFYPEEVEGITGLEPNPGMVRKLKKRLARQRVKVEAVVAGAEAMPFEAASFDTVVTTLTLCSVPDRAGALAEIRRVLKPEGRLVVFEHGEAPDEKVARWQRRLNPVQRVFASGCVLDVPVRQELEAAGFDCADLSERYLPGESRTHGYVYTGECRVNLKP